MHRILPLQMLPIAMALGGCAAVPKMEVAPVLRTPQSLESVQSFSGPHGAFPKDSWWSGFDDPALTALIAEALDNSPDVAIATARVQATEALVLQSRSNLAPGFAIDASTGGRKLSQNQGFPPQFIPGDIRSEGQIAGRFSFSLDFWGKNQANLRAATSDSLAAEVDAAQARLILSTEIASSYFELSRLSALRDVTAEALRIRTEAQALTEARHSQGLDTLGSVRQAEARTESVRGDAAALNEALVLTRNALAALVGAGPDRGHSIVRPPIIFRPYRGVPHYLSLDLIGRRPDLVAARLRSEAEASRIKAARADFYPNINLNAVAGLQSIGLGTLFQSSSTFATFGPALRLPIFDGGGTAGRYRGARARYDEAVAQYDFKLVQAVREVADALARMQGLRERMAAADNELQSLQDARRVIALRYRSGLANRLQLLAADDATIAAKQRVAELQALQLSLDVALIRALGGGFEEATFRKNRPIR